MENDTGTYMEMETLTVTVTEMATTTVTVTQTEMTTTKIPHVEVLQHSRSSCHRQQTWKWIRWLLFCRNERADCCTALHDAKNSGNGHVRAQFHDDTRAFKSIGLFKLVTRNNLTDEKRRKEDMVSDQKRFSSQTGKERERHMCARDLKANLYKPREDAKNSMKRERMEVRYFLQTSERALMNETGDAQVTRLDLLEGVCTARNSVHSDRRSVACESKLPYETETSTTSV